MFEPRTIGMFHCHNKNYVYSHISLRQEIVISLFGKECLIYSVQVIYLNNQLAY